MNEYFSTKACNTLMLNLLNRTNTLLGAWRVDDKDTYIFFPEDIGYIGMMLTRCLTVRMIDRYCLETRIL